MARIQERGRPDDFTSSDELRTRDERELGWGLGSALNNADVHLSNNGTLAAFIAAVHAFFDSREQDP
jgi:hypothetical protein